MTLGNSRMPQARKDAAMAMEKDVFRWSARHRDKYQKRQVCICQRPPTSFQSKNPVQASRMLQFWGWMPALFHLYRHRHAWIAMS